MEEPMSERELAVATIEKLTLVEPRLIAWLDARRPEPDEPFGDEAPENEPPLAA